MHKKSGGDIPAAFFIFLYGHPPAEGGVPINLILRHRDPYGPSLDQRVSPHIIMGSADHTATTNMGIPGTTDIMQKSPRQVILKMFLTPTGRATNIHRIPHNRGEIQIIHRSHIANKVTFISQFFLRSHLRIRFHSWFLLYLRHIRTRRKQNDYSYN